MNATAHTQATQTTTAALQALLRREGWQTDSRPCLGQKTFATAVGDKQALLWLQDWGTTSTNYVLAGEYWSEGRNALSGDSVLIPKNVSADALQSFVARFLKRAQATIDDSYARRLHLRYPADSTSIASEVTA